MHYPIVGRVAVAVILAGLGTASRPFAASTITAAECEEVAPGTYRIHYEAAPAAGAIRIYASESPQHADTTRPVATTTASPVSVSVPPRPGRVYFHLRPASGPVRVVATRRLPLDGATNFRDLGGYRTGDGRFVKWGLLFRSDHLAALTPRDYEYLAALGIRLVCDLRTPGERERAPTQWQGQAPELMSVPVLSNAQVPAVPVPLSPEDFKRRYDAVSNGEALPISSSYSRFVVEYVDSYRQLFGRLLAGHLPALTHCTAGQDRTGVYSAILLTALGVPRETVMADYLLTTRYRLTEAVVEQQRREWRDLYGIDVSPPLVRAMRGLRAETLNATFDVIDQQYGSFDAFRRGALGVSDTDLTSLRDRLLEP